MGLKVHKTGGVIQVANGNLHPPLLQHLIKAVKESLLLLCPGKIGAVGGGKVAEQSLGMNAGQGCDFGAQIRILPGDLKADAAHAGIHGKVKFGGQPHRQSGLGQGQGIGVAVDGGTDIFQNGSGIGLHRGVAQNENGGQDPGTAKLHSLQHGADTEKGTFALQLPGQLNGPVAVGIGLDDSHHRNAHLFPDGIKIGIDPIQVDLNPCVIKIQENPLTWS